MTDSYFRVLSESADSGRYLAEERTAGPWDPGLQHGGPPTALSVRAAERAACEVTEGRVPLVAARISAEFVGPVPVAEIEVHATVERVARTAVLVATTITSGERICLQARTWMIRASDTSHVAHPLAPRSPADGLPGLGARFPYGDSIEWRSESGGIDQDGPGRVWARPRAALVPDEELAGLARVGLVGDSASGVSSELDWSVWSFVNVDLDVHLSRPVQGDWVLLDARTTLGAHGSALARSTVSDLAGELGCTAQTLVLAPRR